MACEVIRTEGAVFALWGKNPSKADIDHVVGTLKTAAREYGQPVVYVTRVPCDAPPPEADVRAYLNVQMPAFADICSSYHVVLEGTGFLAAVKRALLAGLFQLNWSRGKFYVHATASEIPDKLYGVPLARAEKLLQAASNRGLLVSSAPGGQSKFPSSTTASSRAQPPVSGARLAADAKLPAAKATAAKR
jgi:hypothetical protein